MANKNQKSAYEPKVRAKWYFLVEKAGKTVDEVCDLYFISRKTYYKWRNIDRADHAHIPKKEHPETKIKGDIKIFICNEKQRINYGPLKMSLLIERRFGVEISTTAIYKFYKKKELIFRPQKKLAWYTPLKEVVIPHRPGEVVQMDAKYIWEDNTRKYQRTFIDIYTGTQFATVTNTMTAEDSISAFLLAEKYYSFKILGIQSDNGSENRGDFHKHLVEKGVAHYFIPKSSPTWDGAVERAHGVIDQEYYLNPRRTWKTLEEYLYFYNNERIHLGKYLNGMIPVEKLNQYLSTVSPLKVN
ncbi:MAG: DDE-type integrase/transposase/recombinase [Patescibacteria group bacterium]